MKSNSVAMTVFITGRTHYVGGVTMRKQSSGEELDLQEYLNVHFGNHAGLMMSLDSLKRYLDWTSFI